MSDTAVSQAEHVAKAPLVVIPNSGVVQTKDSVLLANGEWSACLFCRHWRLVTDEMLGVPGIRSHDGWAVAAFNEKGRLLLLIPGCRVKSFTACEVATANSETVE